MVRRPTALVALQVVASLGIVAWWAYWFVSGSFARGERCDLVYENSFPVGDLVLAGVLITSAVRIRRRRPDALFFGFVAAGMALSLACLDTTHNLLVGGFSGPAAKVLQKAVFAVVNTLVGVGTLVTLNRDRSAFPGAPDGSVTRGTAGLSALAAVFALGIGVAYARVGGDRPPCAHLAEVPFTLGGLLSAGLGIGGALGWTGRHTRPLVLATGGVLVHCGLVTGLYGVLNPDLVARPYLLVPAGVGALAGVILVSASR